MASPAATGSIASKQDEGTVLSIRNTMSIEIGQTGDVLRKPFTMLSAAALGYSITNTGNAILLTVSSSVILGGSPLFFYGMVFMALVALCVAVSLGELASAFPHAGGQYYWVAQLAPPSCRRFLSYMTAIISWAAVVCIGASTSSAVATVTFQLVAIKHPDFVYKQWMGFLAFEAANLLAALFNVYQRFLPKLGNLFLWLSLSVMVGFFIALLVPGSEKQSASIFFTHYYNVSGWPDTVAFFVGVNAVNWGFSGLDAVTHLAEEIPEPRKNIPVALLVTVGIGFIGGIAIVFTLFFVAVDLSNGLSVFELLTSIYDGNPLAALIMGSILLISAWSSLVGIHTWQARIAWALSRDKGFPFASYLSQLAPEPFGTPLWAHIWSVTWIGVCGFLYLASTTAFNSFISAGIVLQYITYSIPIILLLMRGRNNFEPGPFWCSKVGLFANVVVIVWTVVSLVFYSFPYVLPVQGGQMNYLSAVLVVVFLYAGGYWVLYGRKHYVMMDDQAPLH